MLPLTPRHVYVLDETRRDPRASARVDRMLAAIRADEVREIDEAELDRLCAEKTIPNRGPRWGEIAEPRDPDIVLRNCRFDREGPAFDAFRKQHPNVYWGLAGTGGLAFRGDGDFVKTGCRVCTSAYEFHTAHGCPFRCGYCGYGQHMGIFVNIEEFLEHADQWINRNYFQTIYKWDNATDIACFEPEYDATRLMIEYFARRRDKYLLLYTGKSDNVDYMLDYKHGGRTIIQWSASPRTQAARIERRTASWSRRIEAAGKCQRAGYIVRFRFSPIIPVANWREEYRDLIRLIFEKCTPDVISLCFLGWMNFADLEKSMDLNLLDPWAVREARKAADEMKGKLYGPFPHHVREEVHRFLIDEIRRVSPSTPVALCLETKEMWDRFGAELGLKPDGYLCNCGPTCTPGTCLYESRTQFFRERAAKALEPAYV